MPEPMQSTRSSPSALAGPVSAIRPRTGYRRDDPRRAQRPSVEAPSKVLPHGHVLRVVTPRSEDLAALGVDGTARSGRRTRPARAGTSSTTITRSLSASCGARSSKHLDSCPLINESVHRPCRTARRQTEPYSQCWSIRLPASVTAASDKSARSDHPYRMSREQQRAHRRGRLLLWRALTLSAPETRDFSCRSRAAGCSTRATRHRVHVGERTPRSLIFVPMLLLLPPRRAAARRLVQVARLLPRSVAPIEHQASNAIPHRYLSRSPAPCSRSPTPLLAAGTLTLALLACTRRDALVTTCRCRSGSRSMPDQRRVFAWIYLVDVLLAPIGLLAALAGRDHALAVPPVMPARRAARDLRPRAPRADRERARAQPPRRARSASGCSSTRCGHSSDAIVIVGADRLAAERHRRRSSALFGAGLGGGRSRAARRAHIPTTSRSPRARFLAARPRPARTARRARPSGACAHADGSLSPRLRRSATNLLDDPRVAGLVL